MAQMWTIPILVVLWLADHPAPSPPAPRAGGGGDPRRARMPALPGADELATAAGAALVMFGAAEQLTHPLGLWSATAKVRWSVGHVAIYVLLPEAALGAAALVAFRLSAGQGWAGKAAAAAAVAVFYTGALAVSYLFVEELRVFG